MTDLPKNYHNLSGYQDTEIGRTNTNETGSQVLPGSDQITPHAPPPATRHNTTTHPP